MRHSFKFMIPLLASLFIFGCNSNKEQNNDDKNPNASSNMLKEVESKGENNKGIGKFNNIQLTHPLDVALIAKGQPIYETKCVACHKLTDEKLVGPGWKGVTDRRTPEWIMNFITNTNVMLDSDLIAQKMFITCLVRMPSQGVSEEEARGILEFMRKNDGKN